MESGMEKLIASSKAELTGSKKMVAPDSLYDLTKKLTTQQELLKSFVQAAVALKENNAAAMRSGTVDTLHSVITATVRDMRTLSMKITRFKATTDEDADKSPTVEASDR